MDVAAELRRDGKGDLWSMGRLMSVAWSARCLVVVVLSRWITKLEVGNEVRAGVANGRGSECASERRDSIFLGHAEMMVKLSFVLKKWYSTGTCLGTRLVKVASMNQKLHVSGKKKLRLHKMCC